MTFQQGKNEDLLGQLATNIADILAHLTPEENVRLITEIDRIKRAKRALEVLDLWNQEQSAFTYWILLLTGVNQEDEMRIAKDLLAWQCFFAKHSARVLCIQSSERDMFALCLRELNVDNFPTLIVSDRPDMETYLKIEAGLLDSLTGQVSSLHSFFVKLQSLIESGLSLQQVYSTMLTRSLWRGDETILISVTNYVSINKRRGDQFMTKQHVFISYCHDNATDVTQLRDELIAAGESTWWDQDIKPGQDWKQEIRRALQQSYAVVICFSVEATARAKSGMFPEALEAIAVYREYAPGSIFLIPVRLSHCDIPDFEIDSTRTLTRLQYVDVFPGANRDAGVQRLIDALKLAPEHP